MTEVKRLVQAPDSFRSRKQPSTALRGGALRATAGEKHEYIEHDDTWRALYSWRHPTEDQYEHNPA